jgi:hypothetical protein
VHGETGLEKLEPEQFLDPNLRLPLGITRQILLQDNPSLLDPMMKHHMSPLPPLLHVNGPVHAPVLQFIGNTVHDQLQYDAGKHSFPI